MWYLLASALLATTFAGPTPKTFKLCVPHSVNEACLQMVEQGKSVGVNMACVPARDRLECLEKLKDHEADWEAVDPEDMYVAARKFSNDFQVFKEIRTKEEPDAEFRYEAVVVIHKDFNIKSVEGLRGHKSCHTGVGRNVGYKIPITKLGKMGILPSINDTKMSPRENELKALSSFFSKSCVVGKWSPDPETNRRLKEQYSNLCQLCEFPDKCDYPDQNSGYEGALRCLAVGGGEVAFTKVIFVKKFFGMAYGSQPAAPSQYNPEDYSYFCPDASKRPIKGEPCIWAARPWPGYMTIEQEQDQIAVLREDITKLNNLGESSHAEWITSVLALNNKTIARDNKGPFKPLEYLEKAKYADVIERGALDPRSVRICTSSSLELQKCQDLVSGAYSRDIRPVMSCVSKGSVEECLTAVRDGQADVVSLDAGLATNAIKKFSLEPVLMEEYEDDHKVTSVAVVKKASSFQKWSDLQGHKACLSDVGEAAGWVMPVQTLMEKGLIDKTNCPYSKAIAEFFAFGTKFSEDAFHCLSSGGGEVAFLDYDSAKKHIDAGNMDSSDFELLCKEGRKPFDQYASCNLGTVPPRLILARKDLSVVEKDDINFALMSAADLYHKHPEYFLMFGAYNGKGDVLFSNAASGLDSVHDNSALSDFTKIQDQLKICTPEESKP